MNADDFVTGLRDTALPILAQANWTGRFHYLGRVSLNTWATIKPTPNPKADDPLIDLVTRYKVNGMVIGDFMLVTPEQIFPVAHFASDKTRNFYVSVMDNQVHLSPRHQPALEPVGQNSQQFVECLYLYATEYVAKANLDVISRTAMLNSLKNYFISKIQHIPGHQWWHSVLDISLRSPNA